MVNQVSPFSSPLDFFRPIYSGIDSEGLYEGENFACLRESINLFDFGQRGFALLPKGMDDKLVLADAEGAQQSTLEIAIRIAKIATIIIPLLKLGGALIYFLANDFQLQVPQEEVLVERVKVERTDAPVFDWLNDDLIRLFFEYLGPAFYPQLASTNHRAHTIMQEDTSLGKFQIGRDILKQCFAFAHIENPNFKKTVQKAQSHLVKFLAGYDLKAALEKANSIEDLKYKVSSLVTVSEAFAEVDKEESLAILRHAYRETQHVGQRAKSFFGTVIEDEHYSWVSSSVRLIHSFTKYDMNIASKIFREVEGEFPSIDWMDYYGSLKWKLEIYKPVDYLKCEMKAAVEERNNFACVVSYFKKLFAVLPKKAELLLEDFLVFLDEFVERFPEKKGRKIYFLLDLAEILVEYDRERACEFAELAMSDAELTYFESRDAPEYYIKYVKVLAKNDHIKAREAANQALALINKFTYKYLKGKELLDLSEIIAPVDEALAKELVERVIKIIPELPAWYGLELAARVPALIIYSEEQTFEMLGIVLEKIKMVLEMPSYNYKSEMSHLALSFKAAAKLNFMRAKEIAENLENRDMRLTALPAVAEGILASTGPR